MCLQAILYIRVHGYWSVSNQHVKPAELEPTRTQTLCRSSLNPISVVRVLSKFHELDNRRTATFFAHLELVRSQMEAAQGQGTSAGPGKGIGKAGTPAKGKRVTKPTAESYYRTRSGMIGSGMIGSERDREQLSESSSRAASQHDMHDMALLHSPHDDLTGLAEVVLERSSLRSGSALWDAPVALWDTPEQLDSGMGSRLVVGVVGEHERGYAAARGVPERGHAAAREALQYLSCSKGASPVPERGYDAARAVCEGKVSTSAVANSVAKSQPSTGARKAKVPQTGLPTEHAEMFGGWTTADEIELVTLSQEVMDRLGVTSYVASVC